MRQGSKRAMDKVQAKPHAATTVRKRSKTKAKASPLVAAKTSKRDGSELGKPEKRLAEALQRQAATDEILRVMSSSPGNLHPVLNAVAERAAGLCDAAFAQVLLVEGDVLRPTAAYWAGIGLDRAPGPKRTWPLTREMVIGRATLDCVTVHHADVVPLLNRADLRAKQQELGFRAVLAVPLLREGGASGVIFMFRREPRPFSPDQIALVESFARQAAIAIENARLFNETKEALEQQRATSEVLKVIGRSAFDVGPVFETLAENAVRLCAAERGLIFRFDGKLLRYAVGHNVSPELRAFFEANPIPLGRGSNSGRAALERRTVHNHDVRSDPEYSYGGAHVDPYRTVLAVPMLKSEELLGVILIYRHEVRPFSESQIALVETFADQAAIAIENVRLFKELAARNRELTEALEQQTATAEILQVISRSHTELQPVFDAIVRNAARLCDGMFANLVRFDGELLHFVATSNTEPEFLARLREIYPMRPDDTQVAGRVVLRRSTVVMEDALADPLYPRELALAGRWRRMLGVPMMRGDTTLGVILVGWPDPGSIPNVYEELLRTFADQAVIAIENVRLFTELQARTAELTRSVSELRALGDVGQAVSSTLDLETVLSTIVARATELTGMDGGSIYEYDEARREFHLHTAHRLPEELVDTLRATPIRRNEGVLGRMAATREPVAISDIMDERAYQSRVREALVRLGYRSILAVPLRRDDQLLGGLAVNRKTAGAFDPQVIDLLETFATQSAIAIQNARLFREIEIKSRELETASRHKSEFLANMSHELRTPLNAIIGFSEVLSERMFGEINEKQAEYIADILQSGQHLLSLINDILDLSKIEAGRMELELSDFDLPSAIENTVTLVRERAIRRGIALARTVDEHLGMIHADERKVKQVLLNLLSNALKFTPEGGKIEVQAAVSDGAAEISVTDTGFGIAPEDQDTVFEEFRQVGLSSKKVEGTGLGLAISRKFIELHGGRIWVKSQIGSGSTFAFTLPLRRANA